MLIGLTEKFAIFEYYNKKQSQYQNKKPSQMRWLNFCKNAKKSLVFYAF